MLVFIIVIFTLNLIFGIVNVFNDENYLNRILTLIFLLSYIIGIVFASIMLAN